MSAVNDNQNFLTGVLNDEGLTFNDKVYGLWVSVFKNVKKLFFLFQKLGVDIPFI